ncbi:guanitoxin biosynthesis L-enduracididine beta-hydroxylase GntD [Streptomyces physcomitrii]|uniref:guanitoxin biosynthesis L-enduracididine beta-hydroxylase GntD n=1 Tax=Streptomyces physcomitrii TaxID=2724184 RepID=UPI0028AB7661|nr:guanitoxin biosynthesis L-enduracididine beta-hydroxylase GntD [Streptomyces physcomitrii]
MRDAWTTIELDTAQAAAARELTAALAREHPAPDDEDFLRTVRGRAAALPPHLVRGLTRLRYDDGPPAVLVRGFPVSGDVGPTPAHWRERDPGATLLQDYWLALLASLTGEPFGWSTLQDGRLFHDVLPIRGDERAQTGHGSSALLEFHTEDAFHEHRCDHLLLLALRNPDRVPTTLASVRDVRLTSGEREVLFRPRFLVRPDAEHLRHMDTEEAAAYERPVAVLFGDRADPSVRIDPPYMAALPSDREAAAALERLRAGLAARLAEVVLEPGDALVVDNQRCVHGRAAFRARLDGTDRWLRKLTVTRDLRRSAGRRTGTASRVLLG